MTKSPKNNPILSIIILYYNSKKYLNQCLSSITKSKLGHYQIETIIVNNGAADNIVNTAQKSFKNNPILHPQFIHSPTNLGFSAGNNLGVKHASPSSKYVLFLNDDTTVFPDTVRKMLDFFEKNPKVDAATCYVTLSETNKLAPETHRGFPTPWNTFWHFFGLGIPKLFSKTKLLHSYLNDYKSYSKTQRINCCQGCFLMLKKRVGETIGWWNEKYFFLGEDLDLCFKLHQHHFNLYFYPYAKIIHYHGTSSGLKQTKSSVSKETRLHSAIASTNAMRIFYQENLIHRYPKAMRWFIWAGIKILENYRIFKAKYL